MNPPGYPLPDPSMQYRPSDRFQLYARPSSPPLTDGEFDPRTMLFSGTDRALEAQVNGRLENCRRQKNCKVQPLTDRSSLEVILQQPLATGLADLRYAQVWKVTCMEKTMVARFYDPLYVDDDYRCFDVFKHIDKVIGLEAAAYKALEELQGSMVPRCVGYFLTVVASPAAIEHPFVPFERSVQVTLLEFIPGCDLLSLRPYDPHPMCEMHKTAIQDAALLAFHVMVLHGVQHLDMEERNLILKVRPLSPDPFCDLATCQLRFKVPTKSLVQELDIPGEPSFDYSTLTPEQLDSLPIAVIDFGLICLVDTVVAKYQGSPYFKRGRGISRKALEDMSRPEKQRRAFLRMWRVSP